MTLEDQAEKFPLSNPSAKITSFDWVAVAVGVAVFVGVAAEVAVGVAVEVGVGVRVAVWVGGGCARLGCGRSGGAGSGGGWGRRQGGSGGRRLRAGGVAQLAPGLVADFLVIQGAIEDHAGAAQVVGKQPVQVASLAHGHPRHPGVVILAGGRILIHHFVLVVISYVGDGRIVGVALPDGFHPLAVAVVDEGGE